MTEKHSDLTTLQRRFVEEYIANGFKDAKGAALRAGAAESTARNACANFLCSDVVAAEIDAVRKMMRIASRDKLLGASDKAIDTLIAVMSDDEALASAKVSAARSLIEMAGVGEPLHVEHTGKDGGPIEHAIIGDLRDELTHRREDRAATEGSGGGSEGSGGA
ncbi:MAG: terminase small subunit [Candidatus Eisenbacteria sp.]|nr:terminase small subunit [Candidatus Eisenbacteria bacterium]